MNEIMFIFINLTFFIYIFKKSNSFFDINVINYVKYLCIDFKRKYYFYKKKMVFWSKCDKKLKIKFLKLSFQSF